MKRVRGLKALVHDAVDLTLDLVQEGHESTARAAMAVLGRVPPVADAARAVNEVRRVSTAGILGGGRVLNRAIERWSDSGIELALTALAQQGGDAQAGPVPMRSDAMGTRAWMADAATGALNGIVGDHLSARGNGLDLGMSLRHDDQVLSLQPDALRAALPAPSKRLAVLVHGLSATEWSWCLNAAEYHGDPATHFGSLLERDLGMTALFVRYNSGRHVSENGRLLAEQLEAFFGAYPGEIEEIVLLGHSMGGLVVRSACHYASEKRLKWVLRVRRVLSFGSPHHGAPLEKVGNVAAALLASIDLPGARIPARIIQGRSAGIKDLRYGNLVDEDWLGHDPDALLEDRRQEVPLLDGVAYHFIAATVTRDPEHPLGRLVGDVLVRVPSAQGPAAKHSFTIDTKTFGGVMHHQLQNHPDVYAEVLRACSAA